MDTSKIDNVEIGFNGTRDVCDAYVESADYDGVEMTEEQLDELTDKHPEFVAEHAYELGAWN